MVTHAQMVTKVDGQNFGYQLCRVLYQTDESHFENDIWVVTFGWGNYIVPVWHQAITSIIANLYQNTGLISFIEDVL